MEIKCVLDNKLGPKTWDINGISIKVVRTKDIKDIEYGVMELQRCLKANEPIVHLRQYFSLECIVSLMVYLFQDLSGSYIKHWIGVVFHEQNIFRGYQFPSNRLFQLIIDNDLNLPSYNSDCEREFKKLLQTEYQKCCSEKVEERLKNKNSFADLYKKIGPLMINRLCYNTFHDLAIDYFKYQIECFTKRREVVTANRVYKRVYETFNFKWIDDTVAFRDEIKSLVDNEYDKQRKSFIQSNKKEMNLDNNTWTIYWLNGPAINKTTFDFLKVKSTTIRNEIKYYMQNRLEGLQNPNDVSLQLLPIGFNYITERNHSVKFCADIRPADIRALILYLQNDYISQFNKRLSISSIRKIVQHCGMVVDFLISKSEDNILKYPIPKQNYFSDATFYNTKNMEERTDIIPEEIANKLLESIELLNPLHQKMYKIFIDTGLRLKEVVYLEADCLEPSGYENTRLLKYIPYKILRLRRKKHLEDYQRMLIPEYLAEEIETQIDISKDLREKYNITFIFINQQKGCKAYITQGRGFVSAVNKIIKKNNITDIDGELWNFQSRQIRKTLVVTMIENGATTQEIAYWLGHLGTRTAREYYEEVRKIRLAEMNNEFWKKKFDIIINEDTLTQFTEEERRALYIDFRLKNRKVELGYCAKHISQGPCGYRLGKSNCATCKNLCTGVQYLDEWIKLRDSQQSVVDELLRIYQRENIIDFEGYREYQQEKYFLDSYQDVIDNIQKAQGE